MNVLLVLVILWKGTLLEQVEADSKMYISYNTGDSDEQKYSPMIYNLCEQLRVRVREGGDGLQPALCSFSVD